MDARINRYVYLVVDNNGKEYTAHRDEIETRMVGEDMMQFAHQDDTEDVHSDAQFFIHRETLQ